MQCEICHEQPATIHIHEQVNGNQRIIHICDDCARKKTEEIVGLSIANMICNAKGQINANTAAANVTCPDCGWTQDRFHRTGRLGCAACWSSFRDSLDEGIPSVHRGVFHVGLQPGGRAPEGAPVTATAVATKKKPSVDDEIKALQRQLDAFVAQEDYEAAVVVRDRINKLKKQRDGDSAS